MLGAIPALIIKSHRKTVIYIFTVNLLVVVISCSTSPDKFEWNNLDFIPLKSEQINYPKDSLFPARIKYFHNRIVCVDNYKNNQLIHYLNPTNGKITQSLLNYGYGPHEFHNIYSLDIISDTLFAAYDIESQIIGTFNPQSESPKLTKIKLEHFPVSANFISKDQFITQPRVLVPLKLIYIYSSSSGLIIDRKLDYPLHGQNIDPKNAIEAYTYGLVSSPSGQRRLIFFRHSDLMYIVDSSFTIMKSIKGPHNFDAVFEEHRDGDLFRLLPLTDITRRAYIQAEASEDYFLALYSGAFSLPKNNSNASFIRKTFLFQFDWNGVLLKSYELDTYVQAFTVDFEHKIIYGITDLLQERAIVSYDYSSL